jgi:D-xylose transport system permease protein
VLGPTGSINLTDPRIVGLANTFYSPTVSWIIAAAAIALYAASRISAHLRRARAGLRTDHIALVLLRAGVVAAVTLAATAIFTSDHGMPLSVVVLVAFVRASTT